MVSVRFCKLIDRTFAGCACFCPFVCSVCAPLAFPCLLLVFGRTFPVCACFCAFCCSVDAPLAFPFLCAWLFGAPLLVGHVFSRLVARLALLWRFPTFWIGYWPHVC